MELLKKLVKNSDLSKFKKNQTLNFIEQAKNEQAKRDKVRGIIASVCADNVEEVCLANDAVIIFKIAAKKNNDWSIKYPYRIIHKGLMSEVCPTLDYAMLVYLGKKYDGNNSQFAGYAAKMLSIEIEE